MTFIDFLYATVTVSTFKNPYYYFDDLPFVSTAESRCVLAFFQVLMKENFRQSYRAIPR